MSKFFNYTKGQTTKEDINKAIEKKLDVISQIFGEMANDCDQNSMALLTDYSMATEEERAIMDAVLCSLCGWTMHSIIEKASAADLVIEEE